MEWYSVEDVLKGTVNYETYMSMVAASASDIRGSEAVY